MTTGYVIDVEKAAKDNGFFRKVLFTASKSQLVVMSLLPGEEIGLEVHDGDQLLAIVEGAGIAVIGGVKHTLRSGCVAFVPTGANHNVINTGHGPMKLYTVYAPPQHEPGTVHRTKKDAEGSEHKEALRT